MTALWVGTVVAQVVITLVLGLIVASLRWTVNRLISANDSDHQRTDQRIEQLIAALAAEREARHADIAAVTAETAAVKEERPRRGEIITHYAALSQQVGDVAERVAGLASLIQTRRDP